MALTQLCSLQDVQDRLSVEGVNLRVDDDPEVIDSVLDDASYQVYEHVWLHYAPERLVASPWVAHRTADIAAQLFCERKGNPPPPGIVRKFEAAEKKLERVQAGRLQIPDCPIRKPAVPRLSQGRIRLDPHPRTVIERSRSTGNPQGYSQNTDRLDLPGELLQ